MVRYSPSPPGTDSSNYGIKSVSTPVSHNYAAVRVGDLNVLSQAFEYGTARTQAFSR